MARPRGSLVAALLALGPASALACSLAGNKPWMSDPAEVDADHVPPGPVTLKITGLHRGVGPQRTGVGCGEMSTSCDDLGWVVIHPSAQDDRTPLEKLAVEVELASGKLPGDLQLPTGPVYLENLIWIDDATDDQEPVDFSLRARAVDLAGNRGPWSDPLRVTDPGTSGGGCSAAAGSASLLALAVLALAARRR